MKFAFFTYDGHGLPIAFKLHQEGYDVIVGQAENLEHMPKENEILKERRLKLYDGLIEKVSADKLLELLRKENPEDWFVIADFNYVFPYTEKLAKLGFKGLLPTKEDFEFEENREKAKDLVLRRYPIFSQLEVYEFESVNNAIQFLQENQDKIFGVKGFNPEAPTYFPASNNPKIAHEELIDILQQEKKLYESEGFILEEKVEDLLEFVPEIITFDGEIVGMSVDVEAKYFGAGDIGPQTGCSADIVFWIDKNDPAFQKLYELFFEPIEEIIFRENQMVIWDAGVIYSPSRDKFFFTECSSLREGYNSVFTKLSTLDKVSDYYFSIMNKQFIYQGGFGTSIRIFNELEDEKNKGFSMGNIKIIANLQNKDIWLWDVYLKNSKILNVGYDRNLAVITTKTNNWKEGFRKIDEFLSKGEEFIFPAMYFKRYWDLIQTDYPNNFVNRMQFLEKFLNKKLERKFVSDFESLTEFVQKLEEEEEEEEDTTKQIREDLLRFLDEI